LRKLALRLLPRLVLIFVLSLLVGTAMLMLNNVLLHGSSLRELLRFNIPAVMAGNLLIIAILLLSAYARLSRPASDRDLYAKLLRLPGRLFAGLMAISLLFSGLYHALQFQFYDVPLSSLAWEDYRVLAKNLVAEQTIALIIGLLMYALCRRTVRPYVMRLRAETRTPGRSFAAPLGLAIVGCCFILASSGVEYLLLNEDRPIDIWDIAATVGARFAFCTVVFYLLIVEMRGDARAVLASIKELARGGASATYRPIPVVSGDELGELTEAFNLLQRRMGKEAEEMRRELKLAYHVQQKLLPAVFRTRETFDAAAVSSPSREVGGDVFDIVERGDGSFLVMVGDVSGKGVAASMLMTATLALFRKEARQGASAAEALRALNGLFSETLKGRMYVTMGIGCWNPANGRWTYASAGHVAPYLVRDGRAEELRPSPSFPLGIDSDETYTETIFELRPGDRLLLYTDGIVEAEADDGGMFGFDRLEEALAALPEEGDARELLERLNGFLPPPRQGVYDDDRTMLLLRYAGAAGDGDRTWAEPVAGGASA